MRTKDGSFKWISEVGRGVFDCGGDLEAIEGFLSDLAAEVEVREASQLAERHAIVARMASGIAHDVNNVLTGILGIVNQTRNFASGIEHELSTIEMLVDKAAGSRAGFRILENMR